MPKTRVVEQSWAQRALNRERGAIKRTIDTSSDEGTSAMLKVDSAYRWNFSLLSRNQELPLEDVNNWEGSCELAMTELGFDLSVGLAWTKENAAEKKNVHLETTWVILERCRVKRSLLSLTFLSSFHLGLWFIHLAPLCKWVKDSSR